MENLIAINSREDIPEIYQNTSIELLLQYHNLGKTQEAYSSAQLLVGMCMDNRKHLKIPDNFAYIIRSGGANLRYSEFKVSFAIGVGGVSAIALIGHSQCGMVNVMAKKDLFINGLIDNAGWQEQQAEEHFNQYAPMFEIGNAAEFILMEVERLRNRYPKIPVAPLFYRLEDNKLYFLKEN